MSTVQALEAFGAENRKLATGLAEKEGRVRVLVTFREPHHSDWYRDWIKARGLRVNTSLIHVDDRTGWTLTSFDNSVPDIEEIVWNFGEGEGIFCAWATLDASRLQELAADPDVLIADVTSNIVLADLIYSGVVDEQGAESVQVIPRLSELPIWPMLELGLHNFQR
ncbi:MAG: hypothetical protein M3441_14435 [Chloroflexota bacterium]|nr:hypothetical protein [Chloroflexota bacterium]